MILRKIKTSEADRIHHVGSTCVVLTAAAGGSNVYWRRVFVCVAWRAKTPSGSRGADGPVRKPQNLGGKLAVKANDGVWEASRAVLPGNDAARVNRVRTLHDASRHSWQPSLRDQSGIPRLTFHVKKICGTKCS